MVRIETKLNGPFLKPNMIIKDELKLMINHNGVTLISWYASSEEEATNQIKQIEEKFGLKLEKDDWIKLSFKG